MKQQRVDKVINKMKENKIDQAIISDPYSIFYFTGIMLNPGERLFALILDVNGKHTLFHNALFPIEQDLGIEKVTLFDTDCPTKALSSKLPKGSTVGIDKQLVARFLLPLVNTLKDNTFTDVSQIVDKIRMIKDEEEKELMRKVSHLNDLACEQVIASLSKDKTELDVVEDLLAIHRKLDIDGESFAPIIAYGANGANPHGEPGKRYLKEGDSIIVDMGGIKDYYCSDMTRTVFYKQPSKKAKEVFEIVKEAQRRGVEAVKPGVRFCDIDAACRDYITEKGYGEYFTHRTGHNIGLECHEYGDVSATNTNIVEPGMCFSVEPGIYIPGEFGVRIEDIVMVTEDGVENLNKYKKDFVVIGE